MTVDDRENVVAILADSLRWDVFADAKPQNLLALGTARKAYSFACCTLPSLIGYLMNYPPIGIGEGFFAGTDKEESAGGAWMPRYYQKRGYTTIFMSGNGVPVRFDDENEGALSKYFDHWETLQYLAENREIATPYIIKDLNKLVKSQNVPYFVFILLIDTHSPYHDGENVELIDPRFPEYNYELQLKALKYIDAVFPNFIQIFKKTNRPTQFIFTSDHGENFGGSGWGHSPFRSEVTIGPNLFAIPFIRGWIRDWNQVKVEVE